MNRRKFLKVLGLSVGTFVVGGSMLTETTKHYPFTFRGEMKTNVIDHDQLSGYVHNDHASIDGLSLVRGDKILWTNQNHNSLNGIYKVGV